jgi:ribose transport system ATP-binding protein
MGTWQQTNPSLILLHEPTHGVDIGSRQQILEIVAKVAAAGAAVLVASAEYDELAHLCHRVLFFRHGRIVRELLGDDLTETRIAEQCYLA